MSKRKRKRRAAGPPKTGAVWHLSAEEATLAAKPRYNAHICKTGAHGDAKYNRQKAKRDWNRQLRNEGTPRGPLPFQKRLNPASPSSQVRRERQRGSIWRVQGSRWTGGSWLRPTTGGQRGPCAARLNRSVK